MIDRAVLPSLWICVLLALASLWMIKMHHYAWRVAQGDESLEAYELNFHRRQFRRRMQTSEILGLVGIAILVGHFIRPPLAIAWVAFYWATVLLMVVWILVLACLDAVSTKMHFGRARRRNESQQALVEAQLRRERKEPSDEGTTPRDESAE